MSALTIYLAAGLVPATYFTFNGLQAGHPFEIHPMWMLIILMVFWPLVLAYFLYVALTR